MLPLCVKLTSANDAALLAAKCGEYEEDIDYECGRYVVDAKSLMGVLSVGLGKECILTLHSDDSKLWHQFMDDMELWWVQADEDDVYCYFGGVGES